MITVRAQPLQSTDRLRHAVLEGAYFRDTVDLFAGLIRALNETFADRIDEIGDRLDDVEEGVLDGRHSNWRAELGDVRRRLVEVKRFIDPERNALTQLVTRRLEWAEPRSMEALIQAIQVLNGLGARARRALRTREAAAGRDRRAAFRGHQPQAAVARDHVRVADARDARFRHLRHERGGVAGHARAGIRSGS